MLAARLDRIVTESGIEQLPVRRRAGLADDASVVFAARQVGIELQQRFAQSFLDGLQVL